MKKNTFSLLLFLMFIPFLGYSQDFAEGFENGIPADWTVSDNGIGTSQSWGVTTDPASVNSGSQAAVVLRENIGQGNVSEDWLVTPLLNIEPNKQLRFFSRSLLVGDQGTKYQIRLSLSNATGPTDFANFVVIKEFTESELSADPSIYEEKAVSLVGYSGQGRYIAFVRVFTQTVPAQYGDKWLLDDVRIVTRCLDPYQLTVSNRTGTTANLSWAYDGTSYFDVEYGAYGFTPGSGIGYSEGSNIAGNSYNATNLSSSTLCSFYVRAICDAGIKSDWVGPYVFTTSPFGSICAEAKPINSLPYQTTDNTVNYGDHVDFQQGSLCGATPATTNFFGGNDVFYSYTATTTGVISVTMTPIGASSTNSSLFVYDSCANVGVTCLAGKADVSANVRTVSLNVVTGQTYIIAISSSAATQTFGYNLLIQNENCVPKPTALVATSTLNTANLSWSNDGFALWEVAVQPFGTSVPTGHGISTSANPYAATTLVDGTPLASGTQYQYWVRAECAPGAGSYTAWAGPYAFNTLVCNPSDACTYTFRMTDSANNGWNGANMQVRQNGIVVATLGSAFTSGGGPLDITIPLCKDIPFDLYWNVPGTQPQQCGVSVLNSFGQTIYAKAAGTGTVGAVIYSDTVNCTAPRCDIAPVNLTASASFHSAVLQWDAPATTIWDVYMVPKGDPAPDTNTLPTYNDVTVIPFSATISLLADTDYEFYVRVDCASSAPSAWSSAATFHTLGTCPKPTGLSISGITTTAATFAWTNGAPTDTQWDILLVPSATVTPPAQLPTANPFYPGQILLSGITTPLAINSLTPATIYFYYIRTVCSGTESSVWAGPFVFNTTTCDVANKCNYKFILTDSKGDGWNQGRMQVRQSGIVVTTIGASITGAGPTTVSVPLCTGIPFDLYWSVAGTAPEEIGISIQNPFTDELYKKVPGEGTVNSVLFASDANCTPPSCPKPVALAVINITPTTAVLSWTESGSATQWEVYCVPTGSSAPTNGSPIGDIAPYYIADSNPFIITGLSPATSYTYYVRSICSTADVSTWTILAPKTFVTTPVNDECANAIPVPVNPAKIGNLMAAGSTVGATGSLEGGTICAGTTDDDVWFSFVATAPTHVITIGSIVGNTTDLNHTVYLGSDCAALTQVYCSNPNVSVATNLIAGQTYKIRVYTNGSVAGQTATFTVCITTPPVITNDECITAIPVPVNDGLICNISASGSLAGATASVDAITCIGTADDDVWFSFVATSSTQYFTLQNVTGTTNDLNFGIYAGTCGSLMQKYCAAANSLMGNMSGFLIGETYYVRVWSNSSLLQDVTFDLCIGKVLPAITANTQYTTQQLVTDVLINNICVGISNVTSSTGTDFGSVNGIGYFDRSMSEFPFQKGIILTSGSVINAHGPNTYILSEGSNSWPGDTDLENIVSEGTGIAMTSLNASKLEFDFTSLYEFMSFNFLFASEEYGQFQCAYADAFAFILTDLVTGATKNLAVVPGTSTPVSAITIRDNEFNQGCTSVNPGYFDQYYAPGFENSIPTVGAPTNYNGMTVPMTASAATIPGRRYHIKLVIADRLDTRYDSAIFIEAGSFTSGPPQCANQTKLVAFIDANGNGVKDDSEVNFTDGSFVIQKNNTGDATSVSASLGSYTLYDDNTANTYDVSFLLNSQYVANYTVGTTYNDITIPVGMQTLYFPITVIQSFGDVLVAVIPESNPSPKPGTEFTNTIIYRNMGDTMLSGVISFTTPDLAAITAISQSGTVATVNGFTYAFANLGPNETRMFNVTMKVAGFPTASGGEALNNIASVAVSGNDTESINNTFTYTQVVGDINSPDSATPVHKALTDYIIEAHAEKIPYKSFGSGDYLTYTIRFQNTGTTNAMRIRLEDVLDAKLDETSVLMIGASHNYTLERVHNHLVWNFDYINLVGALQSESLSKGFVTFKIRLKPGFAPGNIIPNAVSIYFDANPAIETNTFKTEFIGTLANTYFADNTILLYPNPATDLVQINTQNTNETLKSVYVYDMLGKKVKMITNLSAQQATMDVSSLVKGVYMVQITSETNLKLIKKLVIQ